MTIRHNYPIRTLHIDIRGRTIFGLMVLILWRQRIMKLIRANYDDALTRTNTLMLGKSKWFRIWLSNISSNCIYPSKLSGWCLTRQFRQKSRHEVYTVSTKSTSLPRRATCLYPLRESSFSAIRRWNPCLENAPSDYRGGVSCQYDAIRLTSFRASLRGFGFHTLISLIRWMILQKRSGKFRKFVRAKTREIMKVLWLLIMKFRSRNKFE